MTKKRLWIVGSATFLVFALVPLIGRGLAVASLSGLHGGTLVAFGDSYAAGEGDPPPAGPTGLLETTLHTGGSIRPGFYHYQVSSVTNGYESLPSQADAVEVVTGGHNEVSLSWDPVTSATSYNVYGRGGSTLFLIATGLTAPAFVDKGNARLSTQTPRQPYSGFPDDSPDAYPSVLASQNGMILDNFAISGACASTASKNITQLPNCIVVSHSPQPRKSVLEDELKTASAMNLSPSLITLTVGGNDVNFKTCAANIFGISLPSAEPCSDSTSALNQIQSNAEKVLIQINALYPGVPIMLTEYADPLPASFSDSNPNSLCAQHTLIYTADEFQQGNSTGGVTTFATNDRGGAGIIYLNNAFSNAESLVSKLDSAAGGGRCGRYRTGCQRDNGAVGFC